jgi:hypothetical protein
MKTTTVVSLAGVILAGALFGHCASANGQSQTGSSTSSNTSVQADKSGAQVSNSNSTAASASAGHNSASLASGTAMNAELSQPVDAKKNKPGDPIAAKTTSATKSNGNVVIPKGTKLVGHVNEAKARAKGESESAVGIVFDKAVLKNGQEIPLNVALQAVAASQTAASSSFAQEELSAGGGAAGGANGGGRASGGGVLGGARSTAGATAGSVANTAGNVGGVAGGAANSTTNVAGTATGATRGAVGGLNAAGELTSNSQGVFGLEGLNLNSATASSTQGSLITSSSKNVHLDSGTKLLLVAQSTASVAGGKP